MQFLRCLTSQGKVCCDCLGTIDFHLFPIHFPFFVTKQGLAFEREPHMLASKQPEWWWVDCNNDNDTY